MKLSDKKQQRLYNVIHEEVMLARIKVAKILRQHNHLESLVDHVLSDLTVNAPMSAINLLNNIKPKQKVK